MNLQIRNLSKTFTYRENVLFGRKKTLQALRDIQIEIKEGESLGIVGESGCGKTTLAKIISGFLSANTGDAFLGDTDLFKLSRHQRSRLVQMVFQDPFASLNPKLLLESQLREAFKEVTKNALSKKLAQSLLEVGLSEDYLRRYPHQLSGGQRQRFAIARALAVEPKILIADEPVSSLDVSVQAQIINLLNSIKTQKKLTQIVISHDLAVIASLCDHVVIMNQGQIVDEGPVDQILSSPNHDITKRLVAASPSL